MQDIMRWQRFQAMLPSFYNGLFLPRIRLVSSGPVPLDTSHSLLPNPSIMIFLYCHFYLLLDSWITQCHNGLGLGFSSTNFFFFWVKCSTNFVPNWTTTSLRYGNISYISCFQYIDLFQPPHPQKKKKRKNSIKLINGIFAYNKK